MIILYVPQTRVYVGPSRGYGEIGLGGWIALFLFFSLTGTDLFVDLGSGYGVPVLMALMFTKVGFVFGVEDDERRYNGSELVLEDMRQWADGQYSLGDDRIKVVKGLIERVTYTMLHSLSPSSRRFVLFLYDRVCLLNPTTYPTHICFP